jgi:hypothetical protein
MRRTPITTAAITLAFNSSASPIPKNPQPCGGPVAEQIFQLRPEARVGCRQHQTPKQTRW